MLRNCSAALDACVRGSSSSSSGGGGGGGNGGNGGKGISGVVVRCVGIGRIMDS